NPHVEGPAGTGWRKVTGRTVEGDEAAVGTHHRVGGGAGAASAGVMLADQRGGPGEQVALVDVTGGVGVAGREVVGVTEEGDVAAVGTDARLAGPGAASRGPTTVDADEDSGPRQQ